MKEYLINDNDEGQTLLKYSFRILESAPQSLIRKFLRNKNIELNCHRADGSEKLRSGDIVKFWLSDETFNKFSEKLSPERDAPEAALDEKLIIYEDADYIIINKPAGILSQSDGTGKVSLNDMLLSYVPSGPAFKPSICNRLDTNTSGLVICGRSVRGLQTMDEAIRAHRIGKYYRCICSGRIEKDMKLEAYLKKDRGRNIVTVTDEPVKGSEKIITMLHVLKCFENASYLEIELITGKSHQIRAHLSHIGHPLIGDLKYGTRDRSAGRQMLHAYRAVMPEDILYGKEFTAPLPEDFERILRELSLKSTSGN